MSEGAQKSSRDARSHEIQSSIAQGKLMLNVLRSLPVSDNIQAFIVRFEELVSRLQKCESERNQGMDAKGDVGAQFEILKKRQDKIKCLLEQTTQELQSTLAESLDHPGPSHAANVNGASTPLTEGLSELQMKSVNRSESSMDPVTPTTSSGETVVIGSVGQLANNLSACSQSVDLKEDLAPSESNIVSSPFDVSSTKWSARFAIPVAKLEGLIEDSRKFQSMVEQLISITRRAHLTEATGFLVDISARFVDLRNSFDSLKKSYEEVRDSADLPSELRELQLTGFQEFLERLDHNLESTKECFFNIYRLVKSEIENSIADGSLLTMVSDSEEVVEGSGQLHQSIGEDSREHSSAEVLGESRQEHREAVSEPDESPVARVTTAAVVTSGDKRSEDPLVSQKAYLAALQEQTARERKEIQRLLQQRDQLAERLETLKATALLSDSVCGTTDDNNHHCPSSSPGVEARQKSDRRAQAAGDTTSDIAGRQNPSPGESLSSSLLFVRQHQLLSHLEEKRRELDRLHAQLSVLREAELKGNTVRLAVAGGAAVDGSAGAGPIGKPSGASRVTRFRSEVLEHGASTPARTHQASTNTEQLYENMREARILLEEQRDHLAVSTDAKTLLQRLAGVASVANSQDRTTLATWGGSSSPVHSSTSTVSGGEEEEEGRDEGDDDVEGDDGRVVSQSSEQLAVVSASASSLLGFSPSEVAVDAVAAPLLDEGLNGQAQPPSSRERRRKLLCSGGSSDGKVRAAGVKAAGQQQAGKSDLVAQLPQLGHSPSPPTQPGRRNQSPGVASAESGVGERQPDSFDGGAAVPLVMPGSELAYALVNERLQRMEMSIAQLFQVCCCLAVENTSLRSTLSQLLLQPMATPTGPPANVNDFVLVNPGGLSHPNSGMATPSPAEPLLVVSPQGQQSAAATAAGYQLLRPSSLVGAGVTQRGCVPPSFAGASAFLVPRTSEPLGQAQLMLLQQQMQQQQLLEAQNLHQQLLSRLLLQQQHQPQPQHQQQCQLQSQVPVLARRPFVQASNNQLNSCDPHWLTGSLCPPLANSSVNTLTVSAERLAPRVATNGFAPAAASVTCSTAGHVCPSSTGLGGLEVGYNNCLLSPQSSVLTGGPSVASGSGMLPIVDPVYQVPISSSAMLFKYTGAIL